MDVNQSNSPRRVLIPAAISAAIVLFLALLLPSWLPTLTFGLVCANLALTGLVFRHHDRTGSFPIVESLIELARDQPLFESHRRNLEALLAISRNPDDIYRESALDRIELLSTELDQIAAGTFIYDTESWRMVYEKLLRSSGLHAYRSVAWIRSDCYWHDEPGRRSMQANLELAQQQKLIIERIAIIADNLWPANESFPIGHIRQWLHEQQVHRISIWLVRESDLLSESDLLVDLGIYGNRAVGFQETGLSGRTARFTLHFDFDRVADAEKQWERLSVYAVSYQELLDRYTLDE